MEINELTKKMAVLKNLINEAESDAKAHKKYYAILEKELIEAMETAGVDSFLVDGVANVRIKIRLDSKINDPRAFYMWLLKRGDNAIADVKFGAEAIDDEIIKRIHGNPENVKIMVHHGRMASYLQDACDIMDESTHPPGVAITPRQTTVLTLKG